MALPLLNVGVWIQEEEIHQSVFEWSLPMADGADSPTWGGFSTFLPHCELGGVRGTAEVHCQKVGFEIAICVFVFFFHDEMYWEFLKVKRFAVVALNTQGSLLMSTQSRWKRKKMCLSKCTWLPILSQYLSSYVVYPISHCRLSLSLLQIINYTLGTYILLTDLASAAGTMWWQSNFKILLNATLRRTQHFWNFIPSVQTWM